jgi:hypothetical protein
MKRFFAVFAALLLGVSAALAQRTDLSGLKICIDPGHGGYDPANDRHVVPDPGTDFWESESNWQKALLLQSLLEAKGATVFLSRSSNNVDPTLSERVAFANANAVDWFHSIHSNATGLAVNNSINYTLMLVREKIVAGGDPVYGPGTGLPETQEAWDISGIMGPKIVSFLRTQRSTQFLDWTFYGGSNGGYTLGVLRGLLMPGELSEGSMHDFFPETRRLMNNDYRKMEAYALLRSWMAYFGVPADNFGIVAGIQTDVSTGKPINFARVRLMPEGSIYTGDGYNNGFYTFDGLAPGSHTVVFETPGATPDSVQVNVPGGGVVFVDRVLQNAAVPNVASSTPVNNDTLFNPTLPIVLNFSKSMDTASVRSAFSLVPAISGRIQWSPNNVSLTFIPDSMLPFNVAFTLTIDTSAHSASGQTLDGNGDGTPGDVFTLLFKTKYVDVVPPHVTESLPAAAAVLRSPTYVLNFMFSEKLNPSSVTVGHFAVKKNGGALLTRTTAYFEANGKVGVNVYLQSPLSPAGSYRVGISSIADSVGNVMPTADAVLFDFTVSPDLYTYAVLDAFDSVLTAWHQPLASIGTAGVDSAALVYIAGVKVDPIPGNAGSAKLTYAWTNGASNPLLTAEFDTSHGNLSLWNKARMMLQAYVFGDGSGNQFRFVVDDSVEAFPSGSPEHREVSPWVTLSWIGWRLVEWDCETDSLGQWTGNGRLEGALRFRGLQLQRGAGGGSAKGEVYFDQLQLAQRVGVVGVPPAAAGLPSRYELYQNFPNPFNPSTQIRFDVPIAGHVRLTIYDVLGREVEVVLDEVREAGRHMVQFDARALASGMYFYRLTASSVVLTRKMMLTK